MMKSQYPKTCLSNGALSVVDRVRKTLLKYDLEIARVESEISLFSETMDFYYGLTDKKSLNKFAYAKISKENYELFLYRLKEHKNCLVQKVNLVAKKYEGDYSNVFMDYFIHSKSVEDITNSTGLKAETINKIIARLSKDIIEYL